MKTKLEILALASQIADAVQSKYSLTTGFQYTEEGVSSDELTLTIAAVLRRELGE